MVYIHIYRYRYRYRYRYIRMYIYTMEYYSAMKKGNPAICNDMNGTRGHYAKWIKSDREKQILYDITYLWNLKKVKLLGTIDLWFSGAREWG